MQQILSLFNRVCYNLRMSGENIEQNTLGLEGQLPPPIEKTPPQVIIRRRILAQARGIEKKRTDWEDIVFNQGTRDEFVKQARRYEISDNIEPLGIFNIPPRTGRATRVGSITGGETVLVIKDSEKSDDRRRKGWSEIIILEKASKNGERKARKFNDGVLDRTIVTASYQGIIDRQVI
jgi:hypothetical protein